MATYAELYEIMAQSSSSAVALRNKVVVAVTIAAEAVRTESLATENHTNRMIWAQEAFDNPAGTADEMFPALLAQNASLTTAQILGATDAAIQSGVNAAVNVFATGA